MTPRPARLRAPAAPRPRSPLPRSAAAWMTLVIGGAAGGCHLILGLDEFEDAPPVDGGDAGVDPCMNGVKDGDETDLDCGGGTCGPCPDLGGCQLGTDCQSLVCVGGTCRPPACDDGLKNGEETAADCGGPSCDRCQIGEGCATYRDCESGVCDGSVCVTYHVWSRQFGDPALQTVVSLAADGQGNAVALGAFSGNVDFGGGTLFSQGPQDMFLVRLADQGTHVSSRSFGGGGTDTGFDMALDAPDHVVLTGGFDINFSFPGGGVLTNAGSLDAFLAKLSGPGDLVWSAGYGDVDGQLGTSVAVDARGNVLMAGIFSGVLDVGAPPPLSDNGSTDIFVAKFDASSAPLWIKGFGDSEPQNKIAVAVDSGGNVILAGYFIGTLNFGGGDLTAMNEDIFVAKLDPLGDHVWSKRFGGPGAQLATDVAVTDADRIVLVGTFGSTVDFGGGPVTSVDGGDAFVAVFDAAGQHVFTRTFGGVGLEAVNAVTTDPLGAAIVTGAFDGSIDLGDGLVQSAGGQDLFVTKLDPAGGVMWARTFGDDADQGAMAVARAGAEHVLVGGSFDGALDFDGNVLQSAGGKDAFVVKLRLP